MHYLGVYISAPRGCCATKFLYALEIDQVLLAQTPKGTGVQPPPPKKKKEKKLIPKIYNWV